MCTAQYNNIPYNIDILLYTLNRVRLVCVRRVYNIYYIKIIKMCSAEAKSCGVCSRHGSTIGYLSIIVMSTILAGILKYTVAPAIVVVASNSSLTGSLLESTQASANLFYSVSDCVSRVESWNYTFIANESEAPGLVFQQNLQTEVTQLGLCVGNFFVMRVSFALALFFAIISLATWCAPLFHNGQWASKCFVYAAALVATFFVPNAFFYGYSHLARVMSFLFILLQMLILVDFSFDWQEDFDLKMQYFEEGSRSGDEAPGRICCIPANSLICVQAGYLVISFVLIASAIVGSVLLYVFYQGCGSNVAIVTVTLIFGIILVVTSVMTCSGGNNEDNQGGDKSIGLLVPAVVFNTCVYYAFSSIRNNPDGTCNPSKASANPDSGTVVLGLFVSGLSLAWVTLRTAQNARGVLTTAAPDDLTSGKKKKRNRRQKRGGGGKKPRTNELERPELDEGEAQRGNTSEGLESMEIEALSDEVGESDMSDDDKMTQSKQIWLFHSIMMFGACYLAMILTQWGDYTGLTAAENTANQSTSLWVNAAGGWVAYMLFLWIRIAPICCPNRDFSDVREGF